jgi:hypothetical protein
MQETPVNRLIIGTLLCISLASAVYAADDVKVRVLVRVWNDDGTPLQNAYVALVPVWRPWSAPLAEAIAESGTQLFTVPKGAYFLVAGARGYDLASEGPFTLYTDVNGNLSAQLKRLKTVSGVVVDEAGKGLAGIQVSQSRAVLQAPFGTSSKLAMDHLSPDWRTVTGTDGKWALAMPNGTVPLLFAADGYAPQWRVYKPDDAAASSVVMRHGSALRVSCDRVDPDLVLSLERDEPDLTGSIPHSWQRQVWAQWMTGNALAWSSLPPGNYAVYARYVDAGFFMDHAVKIGAASIGEGKTTAIRVTLPAARPRAKSIVQLFLDHAKVSDLKDVEDAVATARDGRVRHVGWFLEQAVGGSVLSLNADGMRGPFYAVTPDRFITADGEAVPDVPLRAHIHSRADAYMSVRSAEKDLQLPSSGMAVFYECGLSKAVTVPVEIVNDLARLTAAAGCKSGALSFTPFEPVLVSSALKTGDQNLGDYVLHAAASADVKVVQEPDGNVVPGATVRAFAWDDTPRHQQWIPAAEVQTGPDGWAHLDGLPVLRDLRVVAKNAAGEASLPDDRRAAPRTKFVVDPLLIPKPATMILIPTIKPSVRAAFPASRVMHIIIDPSDARDAATEERQHEMGDAETSVRFESLKPGRWGITAIVNVAGSEALLRADDVELKSGETRKVEAEFEPLVFHGRVLMGGKGVAAHVLLENLSNPEGVRQHFVSLDDGSFNAVLSARGAYSAVVGLKESQSETMPAGEVHFDDPARPVDITVPETAAVTVHVRMNDQPAARKVVEVAHLSEDGGRVKRLDYGRLTDANGDAKFEHLTPGDWLFSVRDDESSRGAEKTISLRESQSAEVALDLQRVGGIRGTVRDANGFPAVNAQVDCLVSDTNGVALRFNGRTDFDGKFSVAGTSTFTLPALCSVATSAGTVDAFRAASGDDVDVHLPTATATLQITDWYSWNRPDTFWLTAPDGRAISLSAVAQTFSRSGLSLRISALAAGHWNLIRIASIAQWNALAIGQFGALPPIADLTMEAGKAKTIQIYDVSAHPGRTN